MNGVRALINPLSERCSLIPDNAIVKETIEGIFFVFDLGGFLNLNWVDIRETDRVEAEMEYGKQ